MPKSLILSIVRFFRVFLTSSINDRDNQRGKFGSFFSNSPIDAIQSRKIRLFRHVRFFCLFLTILLLPIANVSLFSPVRAAEIKLCPNSNFFSNGAYLGQVKTPAVESQSIKIASYFDAPNIVALLSQAQALVQQGQFDKAIPLLQELLGIQDRNAKAHDLMGQIYQNKRQFQFAETEYAKAISCDPSLLEAKYNLALLYCQLGRLSQAAPLLAEATAKDPKNILYIHNLAVIYDRLGESKDALKYYRKAVKDKPNSSYSHYCLGRILQLDKQTDKAIAEYETAIKLDPNNIDAHNNLGVAYNELAQYPESIAEFETALKINGNYPEAQQNLGYAQAHTSLGITYFKSGDKLKAFDEYKMALSIDPNYSDAHYNLALLYQTDNKPDLAIGQYQMAIKLDPQNAKAHNNLGVAYAKFGKMDLARVEYKAALKLKPHFKEAEQNLGALP